MPVIWGAASLPETTDTPAYNVTDVYDAENPVIEVSAEWVTVTFPSSGSTGTPTSYPLGRAPDKDPAWRDRPGGDNSENWAGGLATLQKLLPTT